MSRTDRTYDAVVIGAGLGGLLAAAYIAKRGGAVLVLERLRYLGGRFTTVDQDGFAMTTGALHMAPHGGGGPLARAIQELGLPFDIVPRDVLASFFFRGRHVLWNRPWDVMRMFSAQGRLDMLKITALLSAPWSTRRAEAEPFGAWLRRQTGDGAIHAFFESFVQFAVSVTSDQISFGELRAIHQNVLRYGMPGTPVGGSSRVVRALSEFLNTRGADIRTGADVISIEAADRVRGVTVRDRRTREMHAVDAPLVVSDVGPESTRELLSDSARAVFQDTQAVPKAAGLKLHIVSNRSMIPHNGVMLCLNTRRISGMVEVSRAVPSSVPAGMHMLDTFQVMQSDNLVEERDLALADLRDIFGADFEHYCRVLRTSAFRGRWPVNQAMQGFDLSDQQPLPGLVMVGDAYKSRGHIMVEGVADSVRRVSGTLAA